MKHLILCVYAALSFPLGAISQNLEPVVSASDTLPDPDAYRRSLYLTSSLVPGHFGLETGYANMRRLLRAEGIKNDHGRQWFAWGVGARFHRTYVEVHYAHSWRDNFTAGESRPSGRVNSNSRFFNAGIQLGYAFWQYRNSAALLRCGLQISRYELYLKERTGGAILDFDRFGAPSPPARTWPAMAHTAPALNVSVEIVRGRPKNGQHLAISSRAGYIQGLGQVRWRAENAIGLNAPVDRTGQVYLSVNYWLSHNSKPKSRK